jgi:hypothetical protein
MNLAEFAANYTLLTDDELLSLWADQNTLVPEAAMALDSELRRRGLDRQNATRVKKRFDALAAREAKGRLVKQVAAAKYERNMRHFVGWEEPKFSSPYGRRDIRTMFASIRHRYRVWKSFRDHTGHWPVFSIWFHFLSWLAVLGFTLSAFVWAGERKRESSWIMFAVLGCVLALVGARQLGARLMRKLDWKRYGTQPSSPMSVDKSPFHSSSGQ